MTCEDEDLVRLRSLAETLDGEAARHARRLLNWRTRPAEGSVWSADLLGLLPTPADWERILVERWPTTQVVMIPRDRAIELLRLEIEYRFSPFAAEQEWNRQHAPRTCLWALERPLVLGILQSGVSGCRPEGPSLPD